MLELLVIACMYVTYIIFLLFVIYMCLPLLQNVRDETQDY